MIAFVSGGARSGKSAVGEELARAWRPPESGGLVYLATALVSDDEMATRVARHRRERGEGWMTLEAPLEIADALDRVPVGASVLLDCLTLWASQVMFEAGLEEAAGRRMLRQLIDSARRRRLAAARSRWWWSPTTSTRICRRETRWSGATWPSCSACTAIWPIRLTG